MDHTHNILISGANSGLGAALAEHFSQAGTHLFLTARNETRLKGVAQKCRAKGADVTLQAFDITDANRTEQWVKAIAEKHRIDLLIANAGVMQPMEDGALIETPESAQSHVTTNLISTITLSNAVATIMMQQGVGHIALISSLSAVQPINRGPSYSASKAGLVAYGEALRNQLYPYGIHVSTICPGFLKTPMTDGVKDWQPFMMSPNQAATKIKKAIDKKKAFYAFPKILYLMSLSGQLLPWKLRRLIVRSFG